MTGGLGGGCSAFSFLVRKSAGVITSGERLVGLFSRGRNITKGLYLVAKECSGIMRVAATAGVLKDRRATGLITFRIGSKCSSCKGSGKCGTPVSRRTRFTCAATLGRLLHSSSRGGFVINSHACLF